MIQEIRSLKVEVPDLPRHPVPSNLPVVNANPQCGPLPLEDVRGMWQENYWNITARVSDEFVKRQILPRGRPHWSLLHIALVDDNIATLCFAVDTGDIYGRQFRYVETGVGVNFHQEAFVRGSLSNLPRGTVEVDYYQVLWELLPYRDNIPLSRRGYFRVAVHGFREEGGGSIHIASWQGEFFRRRGVLNLAS